MTERPFFNDSAEGLFDRGHDAINRRDQVAYEAALSELERRSSRLARELAEELAAEGNEIGAPLHGWVPPRGGGLGISISDVAELEFLTDGEIVRRRDQNDSGATSTIWLSTYGFRDPEGEFSGELCARAEAGVDVYLFVSPGPIRRCSAEPQMDYLKRSGIKVHDKTSHSKMRRLRQQTCSRWVCKPEQDVSGCGDLCHQPYPRAAG